MAQHGLHPNVHEQDARQTAYIGSKPKTADRSQHQLHKNASRAGSSECSGAGSGSVAGTHTSHAHSTDRHYRASHADSESDRDTDHSQSDGSEAENGCGHHRRHSPSRHQQQQQQPVPENAHESNSSVEQQMLGTPGPGAYNVPSCFMSPSRPMNASAYVIASPHSQPTVKGRNFPPAEDPCSGGCSPGPLAYAPVLEADSCKPKAASAVFGSARRDEQSKLYIGSEQMNRAAALPKAGPGPGTYRIGRGRTPGRAAPGPPAAPRAAFGPTRTAPQPSRQARSLSSASLTDLTPELHAMILGFRSPRRVGTAPATGMGNMTCGSATSSSSGGTAGADAATVSNRGSTGPSGSGGCAKPWRDAGGVRPVTTPASSGKAWSFGPPEFKQGLQRRRSREANVFISRQHAAVDPGPLVAAAIPGAAYDVDNKLQLLSTHKRDGTAGFGSEKKAADFKAKLYISPEHVKSDPALCSSPGPCTASSSLPGSLGAPLHNKTIAPRYGSPNRCPNEKTPFISKQHMADHAGSNSPGPACYDAAAASLAGTTLGDRRTAHFGSGEREVSGKVKRSFAPGPGAYKGDLTKLSTHAATPAYSLGTSRIGSLLGPAPGHAVPGVGSYSIASADGQCLPSTGTPSIKGRLDRGGIMQDTCSPGPGAYTPRGLCMGEEADELWQQMCNSTGSRSSSRLAQYSAAGRDIHQSDMQRQDRRQQEQKQHSFSSLQQQQQQGLIRSSDGVTEQADTVHAAVEGSCTARSHCSSSGGNKVLVNSSSMKSTQSTGGIKRYCSSAEAQTSAEQAGIAEESESGSNEEACAAGDSDYGGHSSTRLSVRSKLKGFSMYGKGNVPDSRVSPGPAAYQVNEQLAVRHAGSTKVNTCRTSLDRIYISRLHAESQVGLDSPGPAAYNSSSSSALKQLSTHTQGGAFTFGSGSRPEIAKIRF